MEQRRILVAVSGGIAAYKTPELVREFVRAGHTVRCVLTRSAERFVTPLVLETLTGAPARKELFDASEEGEIDHIALADWAELLVVAPATAHLLARLAHGLADDLVTTVALATPAPLLVAPAMNVNMWRHPATRENVAVLRERGATFVGPDAGELACGAGLRLLVTAGGTREPVDAVRYLGNRSSGRMGFAIAAEAARRGAETVLVAGPSALETPAGARRIDVETALEMREAVLAELPKADVVIKAAAVADFRAASRSERKIKKEDLGEGEGLSLELVRNPDILAEICRQKGDRVIVGFAAESHDVLDAARRKLERKGCDLIVANDVSAADSGFDVETNTVSFVWPNRETESLPPLPKREVAARLLDRVRALRGGHA
jgi:phosphopantothenoylcysteine decarboxylase/phosphopantothenate--cysteine ligase